MADLFDFDSDENVVYTNKPSVKPISKNFCGVKHAAGLWVSDVDLKVCGWKLINSKFANTKSHRMITKDNKEINGFGILNSRICVIRKTKLLRFDGMGNLCGIWMKGDGDIRDEKGNKKYSCIRRYLLLFLDENNEPLHDQPLQLTARGMFQIDFENTIRLFKQDMEIAYAKARNRDRTQMNSLWHSMFIFQPSFESKIVGRDNRTSEACMVKSYSKPTDRNWDTFCVAKNDSTNRFISELYYESHKWAVRYS